METHPRKFVIALVSMSMCGQHETYVALLVLESVAVLIKSWLNLDTGTQTTRLCHLFHSKLVDVTLKVCRLVSEHHAHIKNRAKEEVVSKLIHVL